MCCNPCNEVEDDIRESKKCDKKRVNALPKHQCRTQVENVWSMLKIIMSLHRRNFPKNQNPPQEIPSKRR